MAHSPSKDTDKAAFQHGLTVWEDKINIQRKKHNLSVFVCFFLL